MAKYFLLCTHISRGKGGSGTRAAAYRAGERIRDERTNKVHDYSQRCDVAYKEVVVPSDLAGRPDMAWTQDRAVLWNAMEDAGRQCNSRIAREWLVLVPEELTPEQRSQMVRTYAGELADKYRCAVDIAIHLPRPGADSRNHHAHLLMSTREVTPDGVGPRTTLELGGRERHRRGLGPTRDEFLVLRERWAQVTNNALQQAGLTARVDHRSFKEQGIDREPTAVIPKKVFYGERNYGSSAAGDEIRAQHRERAEARLKGPDELARVVAKQKESLRARAVEDFKRRDATPKKVHWGALTREERNEVRRERYKARRAMAAQQSVLKSTSPTAEESAQRWKEYRQSHGPGPTAEESARAWKAFREKQNVPAPSESAATRTRDSSAESTPPDADEARRKSHDQGLEL
jgi:MobA/MobL family